MCVSGGAHSTCSPGHALQYVGGKTFSLGLVQCGCTSQARQCGLLDMLTSAGRKMSIIWIFDRKYTGGEQEECVGIYVSLWGVLGFSLEPLCVF